MAKLKNKSLFQQLHEANLEINKQKKDIQELVTALNNVNKALWDSEINSLIIKHSK